MNETKVQHTPGPWKWTRPWKPDQHDPSYDGAVGELVGDNPSTAVLWYGVDGEENIYCPKRLDASLIVAAPELLAAARYAVSALEESVYDANLRGQVKRAERASARLVALRAAIAKAEGGAR